MGRAVITLPGDPLLDLSPNKVRRLFYLKLAPVVTRQKNHWQRRMFEEWLAAGRPQLHGRCRLAVTIRRARKLDNDGAIASLKCLLDAVCWTREERQGLLPNDSDAWLAAPTVVWEIGRQWRQWPEVRFVFTEEKDDAA